MTQGWVYLFSLLITAVAVAAVYSAAQDAHLGTGALLRKVVGRLGKLLGVLAGLAVIVWIMSQI